jgi:hypothetical protein
MCCGGVDEIPALVGDDSARGFTILETGKKLVGYEDPSNE